MMRSLAAICLLLIVAMAAPPARAGSEIEKIRRVDDWSVFRDGAGDDLLCWIASRARRAAVDLEAAPSLRSGDEVLILFSAGVDEFSAELRGAPAPVGESWLTLDGARYQLFFQDGWGWSRDREVDPLLKAGLSGGGIGTLNLGGASYRFSLEGFAPALAAAEEACARS